MLLVADVRDEHRRQMAQAERELFSIEKLNITRSSIPAVTHIDYSARIQTVHKKTNSRYHALLDAFYDRTGCPVVVNTSFNVRGEPIVCTPEVAFRCFMGTDIEILAIGNCFLRKEDQNQGTRERQLSQGGDPAGTIRVNKNRAGLESRDQKREEVAAEHRHNTDQK